MQCLKEYRNLFLFHTTIQARCSFQLEVLLMQLFFFKNSDSAYLQHIASKAALLCAIPASRKGGEQVEEITHFSKASPCILLVRTEHCPTYLQRRLKSTGCAGPLLRHTVIMPLYGQQCHQHNSHFIVLDLSL